ncbi:hypothetical protein [Kamptonema formosum]|uniref:hypothetical protein n=1 Tax=Kamptonema formosum TaxID=331992 RepID=UPI00034A89B7|nr:hypothetical protein [Oscillatoria sp. PCC 10802]
MNDFRLALGDGNLRENVTKILPVCDFKHSENARRWQPAGGWLFRHAEIHAQLGLAPISGVGGERMPLYPGSQGEESAVGGRLSAY